MVTHVCSPNTLEEERRKNSASSKQPVPQDETCLRLTDWLVDYLLLLFPPDYGIFLFQCLVTYMYKGLCVQVTISSLWSWRHSSWDLSDTGIESQPGPLEEQQMFLITEASPLSRQVFY